MTKSKREQFLKENERYPLRSLTAEGRQAFLHEEDLALKREKAAEKRREEKKEEKAKAEQAATERNKEKEEAAEKFEVAPKEKDKKSWLR